MACLKLISKDTRTATTSVPDDLCRCQPRRCGHRSVSPADARYPDDASPHSTDDLGAASSAVLHQMRTSKRTLYTPRHNTSCCICRGEMLPRMLLLLSNVFKAPYESSILPNLLSPSHEYPSHSPPATRLSFHRFLCCRFVYNSQPTDEYQQFDVVRKA